MVVKVPWVGPTSIFSFLRVPEIVWDLLRIRGCVPSGDLVGGLAIQPFEPVAIAGTPEHHERVDLLGRGHFGGAQGSSGLAWTPNASTGNETRTFTNLTNLQPGQTGSSVDEASGVRANGPPRLNSGRAGSSRSCHGSG